MMKHGKNKIVGIPAENKPQESRVALVPADAATLVANGRTVNIASGAGVGAGFTDEDYSDVGVNVLSSTVAVYAESELIVKVKEPYGNQIQMLRAKHTLMSYLHWPSLSEVLQLKLQATGLWAYAFEAVVLNGERPLLKPMSEIAGKLSVQIGCTHLHTWKGGSGHLLGGVLGGHRGKVVILGAGVAGYNAAAVASGLGASVVVFDIDLAKLEKVQALGPNVTGMISNRQSLWNELYEADLVIGAVKQSNAAAPKILTRDMLGQLAKGSVVVDISVDEGGCFETTRPTTHEDPTYVIDGIVHYAVTNMPGAVAATASVALSNAIVGYVDVLAAENNRDIQRNTHKALLCLQSTMGVDFKAPHVQHTALSEACSLQGITNDLSTFGPAINHSNNNK